MSQPKLPESMPSQNYSSQSAAIAETVSISSDECEITKVVQHSAGNAETQAKDWLSAEATTQSSVSVGQASVEGPLAAVPHHELLRERVDKDGGPGRPPLLSTFLVFFSKSLTCRRAIPPCQLSCARGEGSNARATIQVDICPRPFSGDSDD